MSDSDISEVVIQRLLEVAQEKDRVEVSESKLLSYLQRKMSVDASSAQEAWEAVSNSFRKIVIRKGYIIQWNFIRNIVTVVRILPAEEVESIAELYQRATPAEIERKIRSLSGTDFERFLAAVLSRRPEFRNISLTPATGDGGVDFTGNYFDPLLGCEFRLIGQAKQWAVPVSVGVAREFVGTMALTRVPALIGIMICTNGFTVPAAAALEASQHTIVRWDMGMLLKMSQGIATRQIEISFSVPDDTFWGELIG